MVQVELMIKKKQSIDSIEADAYRRSKDLISIKEEIKPNNIIKEINNFDDVTKENMEEWNRNWPQIPNHIYKIWIIGGCGYGKQNSLFNLVCQQPDIDKT